MSRELPTGWRVVRRSGRPIYARRDGYRVILDAPGRWGIREPGQQGAPFKTFEEQTFAMEWVNNNFPEGQDGTAIHV